MTCRYTRADSTKSGVEDVMYRILAFSIRVVILFRGVEIDICGVSAMIRNLVIGSALPSPTIR